MGPSGHPIDRIDLLAAQGAYQEAIAGAMELLSEPQHHRAALRKIVQAFLAQRNFADAWVYADRLRRIKPPLADDLALAAIVALGGGNAALATEILSDALACDPLHGVAACALARIDVQAAHTDRVVPALAWNAELDDQCGEDIAQLCARGAAEPGIAYVAGGRIRAIANRSRSQGHRFQLRWREVVLTESPPVAAGGAATVAIDFAVPSELAGRVSLSVFRDDGLQLLGSPLDANWLAPPRLDGTMIQDGDTVVVRAWNAADPRRPVAALIEDGDRTAKLIFRPDHARPPGALGDVTPVRHRRSGPGILRARFAVTGEPLSAPAGGDAPRQGAGERRPVDVLIPVYGDAAKTKACLESVLATVDGGMYGVIVIEDGSPDPAVLRLVERLSAQPQVTVLHNPGNLGFVRTVNRGMALHPDRDVVLLNADTVVHGDWLDRLREAAYSDDRVATVTPLSNDATILSYPDPHAPTDIEDVDVAATDRAAAAVAAGQTADIPTGIGFCMYIRRDCLDQVGYFDPVAFGAGYGEENDFCQRAAAAGWRNLAALDIFVGHAGGASFGPSKARRIEAALAVLDARFPRYRQDVDRFIKADPLHPVRRRLDLARLPPAPAGRALLICPKLGGGTDQFVDGQAADLKARGVEVVIARARLDGDEASVTLELPGSPAALNLRYTAEEVTALLADLTAMNIRGVFLHHLTHMPAAVLEALSARWPTQIHVHDYSWICPRINLVNPAGRYCGEPALWACERCLAQRPAELSGHSSIRDLRALSGRLFASANAVVSPSMDTAARIARYFPGAAIRVVPHPEPAAAPRARTEPGGRGARAVRRIAVLGAIGRVKGYDVLLACAEDARRRQLNLEFVLIGYSQSDSELFRTGKVFATGEYKAGEGARLAIDAGCDLAFLPSIWPETWCYALSEIWRAGLEVVAFDIGAQAERIRQNGAGFLIEPDLDPASINDVLLSCSPGTGPVS